jgi:hypothetical protein
MVRSTNNSEKYWGYGLPVGTVGPSAKWIIRKKKPSDSYSKSALLSLPSEG